MTQDPLAVPIHAPAQAYAGASNYMGAYTLCLSMHPARAGDQFSTSGWLTAKAMKSAILDNESDQVALLDRS